MPWFNRFWGNDDLIAFEIDVVCSHVGGAFAVRFVVIVFACAADTQSLVVACFGFREARDFIVICVIVWIAHAFGDISECDAVTVPAAIVLFTNGGVFDDFLVASQCFYVFQVPFVAHALGFAVMEHAVTVPAANLSGTWINDFWRFSIFKFGFYD